MSQIIIAAIIAAVVAGGGAFYGGTQYEKKALSKETSATRQLGRGNGANGQANSRGQGEPGNGNAFGGGFGGGTRGEILSKDDKSATLKLADGGSKIIFVSNETDIQKMTKGTLADLTTGMQILVSGDANSDGSVNAKSINIVPARPAGMDMSKSRPSKNQPAEAVTDASGVKTFSIDGFNFGYSANEIKVKKGDKVKLTFKSTDGFHDFVVDELSVKSKRLQTGQSDTLEFTADKSGTFEFYCSIGRHRQMGMKGNFIVE